MGELLWVGGAECFYGFGGFVVVFVVVVGRNSGGVIGGKIV